MTGSPAEAGRHAVDASPRAPSRWEWLSLAAPLLLWLGLGLVWPGPGERWTRRRAAAAIALGLALCLLPLLPVLPVGFMTTRYTAIPLAGFLLAAAGAASEGLANRGAVLSFVLDPSGGPILLEVPPETRDVAPYQTVAHVDGGFITLPGTAPTARDAAREWQDRGFPVCVLASWKGR